MNNNNSEIKMAVDAYINLFKDYLNPFEYIKKGKIQEHSKLYRFFKNKIKSLKNSEKTVIEYDAKIPIILIVHEETNLTVEENLEYVIKESKIGYINIESGHIPEDSDDDKYMKIELTTLTPLKIDGITVPKFKIITSNKNDSYRFETHVLIKDGKNYVRQNNFNHLINKHKVLNL